MRKFFDWLADQCRDWTPSCIPEHLTLPEIDAAGFHAGKMRRSASLSDSQDMTFGIFELLGYEEAQRANRAWRPSVLLAMEEVSLSFHLLERQRLIGEVVSRENIERLVVALYAYYERSGRRRSKESIQEQIEQWVATRSMPDAEPISPVRRQVAVRLPLLHELRRIDQEVSERFIGMHGRPATLECIGLILDKELDDSRYDFCTPLNCRTFANTGGDGAHFSLLVIDDAITENSPVVVTEPDAGSSYMIAGSLIDFLRLGCQKGYFGLGCFSPDGTLTEYLGPVGALPSEDYLTSDYQLQTLAYLRENLNLKPWLDRTPYDELQSRYAGALRYPPE